MELLRCEGVRKVYGSGNSQTAALNGIDLTVEKGEFTAIVGASGAVCGNHRTYRFGKVHTAAYPWRCGQAYGGEGLGGWDGTSKIEQDGGCNFSEKEGGFGLSIL